MPGKIFINYRRGDDPGNTGRLFDQLEGVFPRDQLFMDVDSIPPGRNFVRFLEQQVAQCDVLLAIIGKGWLDARDEQGVRRLDKPDDFVRIEIESALKQDKLVIPVLVQEARMPRPDELPEEIRPLALCNAVRLTHERFKTDAQGLIKAIQVVLEEVSALRQAQEEAARKAQAEEERRREEAAALQRAQEQREADERARQEKEQARQAALAGLSPEQIAKAEELAHWDFIKAGDNVQDVRDHLARFPAGVTERFARARLEELVWISLGATPTLDQLGDFLNEFPQGTHAKTALARRAALMREQADKREASERRQRETEAWAAASNAGDVASLVAFLREWPDSRHVELARSKLRALERAPTRRRLVQGAGAATCLLTVGGVIWMLEARRSTEPEPPALQPQPPPAQPQPPPPTEPQLPARLLRTFTGHLDYVVAVAFSPDGLTALSGSSDKTLKLWTVATGKEVRTFRGHSDNVVAVAFSPDGRTVLSGSWDKTLKLWEAATGRELHTFTGHTEGVYAVVFSPNGRTAISASEDGTFKLWEVATGKEQRTFRGHVASSVALSPNGLTALSGSSDKTLKLWTVATGKEVRTFRGHSDFVIAVAFSPDGRTALSGSRDSTLKLWEVATGKQLHTFTGHTQFVYAVAFSPDGRTVLSGSLDKTLKLWEAATGRELHTFAGHTQFVYAVAFSPDGRTALSGGDGPLKLWDLTGL